MEVLFLYNKKFLRKFLLYKKRSTMDAHSCEKNSCLPGMQNSAGHNLKLNKIDKNKFVFLP